MNDSEVTEGPSFSVMPTGRLRRAVAKRMLTSVTEKPHVTLHRRARVDELMLEVDLIRAEAPAAERRQLSISAAVACAVASALAADGRLNGRKEESEIRIYRDVNLAIAVDVDGGLVAPVIRNADLLDLLGMGSELIRLATKAREGALEPADVSDATFTISNLGMLGVEFFTPIINPPQLAILGVGSIIEQLVLIGGEVNTTKLMGLSLSFDHAVTDGAEAARFLQRIVEFVETPRQYLRGGSDE